MLRLRIVLLAVATLAVVGVAAIGQAEHTAGGDKVAPVVSREAPLTHPKQLLSLVKVGFDNLGGNGFNGDIWVHGDYAYVGRWGISGICPSSGVRVIDISNPLDPVLVQSLPTPNGSRANDVKVAAISTESFQGDLLVASNESCGGGARGIQVWDVTDPLNPAELGRFDTRDVHDTYLYQRGDRAYVLLAVPFSEVFGPSAGLPASDLQIIDVTDPASPFLAGEWTIGRDAGLAFGAPGLTGAGLPAGSDCTPPPTTPDFCRGTSASVYVHDVWASADGAVAYLSYWDAGLVTLDISDPTSPTLIAVATEPLGDEGNAHSAVVDDVSDLIVLGDEDFTQNPWGFLRVLDEFDPANPVEVGTFATANALAPSPPDSGWYTAHNITLADGLAYVAWYSDGVRVLDLTHPFGPEEVASFVPPDVADPNGFLPAKALVWGTAVQDDIVFASDMNAGLYVLGFDSDLDGCADVQEESPNPAQGGQRDSTSFWDFFDVPVGGSPRDRIVDAFDIGAVVLRFGTFADSPPSTEEALAQALTPPPDMTSYHAAFDRGSPIPGQNLWNLQPPNGAIDAFDIAAVVVQFGHTCA